MTLQETINAIKADLVKIYDNSNFFGVTEVIREDISNGITLKQKVENQRTHEVTTTNVLTLKSDVIEIENDENLTIPSLEKIIPPADGYYVGHDAELTEIKPTASEIYVDANATGESLGSVIFPYHTMLEAFTNVPIGAMIHVAAGDYSTETLPTITNNVSVIGENIDTRNSVILGNISIKGDVNLKDIFVKGTVAILSPDSTSGLIYLQNVTLNKDVTHYAGDVFIRDSVIRGGKFIQGNGYIYMKNVDASDDKDFLLTINNAGATLVTTDCVGLAIRGVLGKHVDLGGSTFITSTVQSEQGLVYESGFTLVSILSGSVVNPDHSKFMPISIGNKVDYYLGVLQFDYIHSAISATAYRIEGALTSTQVIDRYHRDEGYTNPNPMYRGRVDAVTEIIDPVVGNFCVIDTTGVQFLYNGTDWEEQDANHLRSVWNPYLNGHLDGIAKELIDLKALVALGLRTPIALDKESKLPAIVEGTTPPGTYYVIGNMDVTSPMNLRTGRAWYNPTASVDSWQKIVDSVLFADNDTVIINSDDKVAVNVPNLVDGSTIETTTVDGKSKLHVPDNALYAHVSDIQDNLITADATKTLSAKMGVELDEKKVNFVDIINNLESQIANKPLSANQGYVLDGKKVDKSTTGHILYGTTENGSQTTYPLEREKNAAGEYEDEAFIHLTTKAYADSQDDGKAGKPPYYSGANIAGTLIDLGYIKVDVDNGTGEFEVLFDIFYNETNNGQSINHSQILGHFVGETNYTTVPGDLRTGMIQVGSDDIPVYWFWNYYPSYGEYYSWRIWIPMSTVGINRRSSVRCLAWAKSRDLNLNGYDYILRPEVSITTPTVAPQPADGGFTQIRNYTNQNKYSTLESIVGYWNQDPTLPKPIYRKLVEGTIGASVAAGGTREIITTITGVDIPIQFGGYFEDAFNHKAMIPQSDTINGNTGVCYVNNAGAVVLRIQNGADVALASTKKYMVWAEYLKT